MPTKVSRNPSFIIWMLILHVCTLIWNELLGPSGIYILLLFMMSSWQVYTFMPLSIETKLRVLYNPKWTMRNVTCKMFKSGASFWRVHKLWYFFPLCKIKILDGSLSVVTLTKHRPIMIFLNLRKQIVSF